MGHGIAQTLGQWSLETRLYDVDSGSLERGLDKIRENLSKGVQRGKVPNDIREKTLAMVSGTTDLAKALDGSQLVIEAVPEKLELKQSLFKQISALAAPDALLATNTSSLSVSQIASVVKNPERVVGLHFFNPVHIMKLVEVVEAEQTSEDSVVCAMELVRRIEKIQFM